MTSDLILKITIDAHSRVRVTPKFARFPHIYREAMEVGWNSETNSLIAPPDSSRVNLATPDWWFAQILSATQEQGYSLNLTSSTVFENVPKALRPDLKSAFERVASFKRPPSPVSADPWAPGKRSDADRAFANAKHLFHEGNFAAFVRQISEHELFLSETQKLFMESAKKRI